MGDIPLSPRQKYRLMLLEGLEEAIKLNVKGEPKAFWRQVRSLIMLLSRYMPEEIRQEVIKIVKTTKAKAKSVKENPYKSAKEKEAELNEIYQESAQELLDYLSWVVTHSPVVGVDVEGALFVNVKTIEDLQRIGEEIKNLKMEVEMVESTSETSND